MAMFNPDWRQLAECVCVVPAPDGRTATRTARQQWQATCVPRPIIVAWDPGRERSVPHTMT